MELAGAKLCFQYLKNSGLSILSFISNRHWGNAKWIRESQTETRHFLDLWHIVKGITKQLKIASKKKGNEKIQVRLKAIRGDLNWCALSSKQGFEDTILANWQFAIRPISNKHTDHPDPLYDNCAMDNWNLVIRSNQVGIMSLCKKLNDYIIIILLLQ